MTCCLRDWSKAATEFLRVALSVVPSVICECRVGCWTGATSLGGNADSDWSLR